MPRKTSHFQNAESPFEGVLRSLRLSRITKHIPNNSVVLDAGCGYEGYLLFSIKNSIKKGVGVDVSVAKLNDKKIQLIKGNLDKKLPFKNNTFDIVISMANLEHLNYPSKALKEFYRVLKPKGKLIITTPSLFNKPVLEFLAYKLHLISEEEIRDHKQYYTRKSLNEDLINAQFNQQKVNVTSFQLGLNLFAIAQK